MTPEQVYWAVLNSLWQSAFLSLAVGAAVRIFPGLSAAQRHALWFAVLAAAAILPFADLGLPARSIRVPARTVASMPISRIALPAWYPDRTVRRSPELVRGARAYKAWRARASQAPLWIWVLVSAAMLMRLSLGYLRLRSAKSALIRSDYLSSSAAELFPSAARRCDVGLSASLSEPCVVGFLHPAIAVPAAIASSLARADLERVLRHEYAHIARYDDFANLARQIVRAVLFFNPAVHVAFRAMAIECEIACDDAAAAGERDRIEFAKCLYEIARAAKRRTYSPAAGFIGSRKQIVLRVARLLERNHRTSARLGMAVKMAAVAVLAAGIALGSLRLSAAADAIGRAAPVLVFSGNATVTTSGPQKPLAAHASWAYAAQPAAIADVPVKIGAVPVILRPKQHRVTFAARIVAQTQAAQTGDRGSDLIEALRAAGYYGVTVDDLIELANHGVSGTFVLQLKSYGIGPIPVRALVGLADHGVTPQYVDGMRDAGYTNLSAEDLVRLQDHGVSVDYARRTNNAMGRRLSVDDLIRLRDSGV